MAFSTRSVKVPQNSATMEEARARVIAFFKDACRSLPAITEIYHLDDVVTQSELRSTISSEIRRFSNIENPKVVDLLLLKAIEELGNVVQHVKQRHQVVGQYVLRKKGVLHDSTTEHNQGMSDFLSNFYKSNYC